MAKIIVGCLIAIVIAAGGALFWLKVQYDASPMGQEQSRSDHLLDSVEREWESFASMSPVDDSKTVRISTTALTPIPGQSEQLIWPELVVRCDGDTMMLIVDWIRYISAGKTDVTYRIDKKPAKSETWQASTSHEAIGLWSGKESVPVLQEMLGAEQMYIEVTPYSENKIFTKFSLLGLQEEIKPLRQACHW